MNWGRRARCAWAEKLGGAPAHMGGRGAAFYDEKGREMKDGQWNGTRAVTWAVAGIGAVGKRSAMCCIEHERAKSSARGSEWRHSTEGLP